jgi:gas vesicle protein
MAEKKNGFAAGALIGAAVGAVAALLYAPKSGKETRDDLKKKAKDMKDQAQVEADKAMKKANDVKDDVAAKADRLKKDAQAAAEDWRGRASRVVETAKDEFNKQSVDDTKRTSRKS